VHNVCSNEHSGVRCRTKVPRENTNRKRFRKDALSKVNVSYPQLIGLLSDLHRLTEYDERMRHVATHETFLFLGVTFAADFSKTYEIDSVLSWRDPESEGEIKIQNMIRTVIRKFVVEDKHHIRDIRRRALDFVKCSRDSIKNCDRRNDKVL